MKTSLLLLAGLLLATPAFSELTEREIERAKTTAVAQGKLVAFHYEQAYWDPNCPKCISSVDESNQAIKKAMPRKYAAIVSVGAKEKLDPAKLPASVRNFTVRPAIVVMSADGSKLVARLSGNPSKDEVKEFEKKLAEAVLK